MSNETINKILDTNKTTVSWQYCKSLNDINMAIACNDENWKGLTDANDIISITYDTSHNCYVVFWKHREVRQYWDGFLDGKHAAANSMLDHISRLRKDVKNGYTVDIVDEIEKRALVLKGGEQE